MLVKSPLLQLLAFVSVMFSTKQSSLLSLLSKSDFSPMSSEKILEVDAEPTKCPK